MEYGVHKWNLQRIEFTYYAFCFIKTHDVLQIYTYEFLEEYSFLFCVSLCKLLSPCVIM